MSTKSKSSSKSSSKVTAAATVILKLVTTKPGHYTKKRINEKLSEKFDRKTLVAARTSLWKANKIRKANNRYILKPTKKAA